MVDARDGPEWRGHRPRSIKLRGRGSKFVLDLPGSDRKSDANPMRFRFKADADPRMFRWRLRELAERCVLEPRPVSDHSWRATPRSESSRLVGWSAGRRDGRNPRKKRIPVCWDSRVSSSHLVSARTARTARAARAARTARTAEPAVEESGVLGQLSDSSSSAMASVRGQRSGKISARTSMNRASATVERRIVQRVMGPGASFGVQASVCFQATGRGPLAGLLAGRLSGSQGRSAEESPAVGGNQVVRFPRARFSSISSSE